MKIKKNNKIISFGVNKIKNPGKIYSSLSKMLMKIIPENIPDEYYIPKNFKPVFQDSKWRMKINKNDKGADSLYRMIEKLIENHPKEHGKNTDDGMLSYMGYMIEKNNNVYDISIAKKISDNQETEIIIIRLSKEQKSPISKDFIGMDPLLDIGIYKSGFEYTTAILEYEKIGLKFLDNLIEELRS